MKKIAKIGEILIKEGIISGIQLENILGVQDRQPERSVGEIAADLYAIREDEIESIFGNHILLQVVKEWFQAGLTEKLPNLALDTIISSIDVQISRFTRSAIAQKEFVKGGGPLFQGAEEKKYLYKINCEVDKVIIKTAMGPEIAFENLTVEYDVQSQQLKVDNAAVLLEAKIRLIQLVKGQPFSAPPS